MSNIQNVIEVLGTKCPNLLINNNNNSLNIMVGMNKNLNIMVGMNLAVFFSHNK